MQSPTSKPAVTSVSMSIVFAVPLPRRDLPFRTPSLHYFSTPPAPPPLCPCRQPSKGKRRPPEAAAPETTPTTSSSAPLQLPPRAVNITGTRGKRTSYSSPLEGGRRPRELPWLVTPTPSPNQTMKSSNSAPAARPSTTGTTARGRGGGGGGDGDGGGDGESGSTYGFTTVGSTGGRATSSRNDEGGCRGEVGPTRQKKVGRAVVGAEKVGSCVVLHCGCLSHTLQQHWRELSNTLTLPNNGVTHLVVLTRVVRRTKTFFLHLNHRKTWQSL